MTYVTFSETLRGTYFLIILEIPWHLGIESRGLAAETPTEPPRVIEAQGDTQDLSINWLEAGWLRLKYCLQS